MEQEEVSVPQLDIEALFTFIYRLFTQDYDVTGLVAFIAGTWDFINFAAVFLAPLLLAGIVYAHIRKGQIMKLDKERFEAAVAAAKSDVRESSRWMRIVDAVSGNSPLEWRHAVIDADVMLDDALRERGYVGETLGEMLKNVPAGGIQNIEAAWEAHKVRNEIAHAGSDFILSQREARRAIDNYRVVFDELGII